MPYGVAKSKGGDSLRNDAWMERCVSAVMAKGSDKVTAIKICKVKMTTKGKRRG